MKGNKVGKVGEECRSGININAGLWKLAPNQHPDRLAFKYWPSLAGWGMNSGPLCPPSFRDCNGLPAAQRVRTIRVSWRSKGGNGPCTSTIGPIHASARSCRATLKFKAMLQSYLCFQGPSEAIGSFVLRKSYRSVLLSFLKLKPSLFLLNLATHLHPALSSPRWTDILLSVRFYMQTGCFKYPN